MFKILFRSLQFSTFFFNFFGTVWNFGHSQTVDFCTFFVLLQGLYLCDSAIFSTNKVSLETRSFLELFSPFSSLTFLVPAITPTLLLQNNTLLSNSQGSAHHFSSSLQVDPTTVCMLIPFPEHGTCTCNFSSLCTMMFGSGHIWAL